MPSFFTARRRNQLALAFSALIFIAIGVGIFVGARRSLADAALVSHTHEVIGRVDEIQARVLDAESAQRGFRSPATMPICSTIKPASSACRSCSTTCVA